MNRTFLSLIELSAAEQLLQVVALPDLPVGEVRQGGYAAGVQDHVAVRPQDPVADQGRVVGGEHALEPRIVRQPAHHVLRQLEVVVRVELVQVEERHVRQVPHPVVVQHQQPRPAGCGAVEVQHLVPGPHDQPPGGPGGVGHAQVDVQLGHLPQRPAEVLGEPVANDVVLQGLGTPRDAYVPVALLRGSDVQHPLDEVHDRRYGGPRGLAGAVGHEPQHGEGPVADVDAEVPSPVLPQPGVVRPQSVPDEHLPPVDRHPLVDDGVRGGLAVLVLDVAGIVSENVRERGVRDVRVTVEESERVLLLHLGLEVGQDRDHIEEGEPEVGLAAPIPPDHHALVHEAVPDASGVERVVPDLREVHLDAVPESPVVLHGESLQHDNHRNFITDVMAVHVFQIEESRPAADVCTRST